MADREQLSILMGGVGAWNRWKEEHPEHSIDLSSANLALRDFEGVDLRGANLRNAVLDESNFHEAMLDAADFTGGHLHETDLSRAALRSATLCRVDLSEANLSRAWLQGADLSYASLWGAYISRAKLMNANLAGALIANTTFADIDFSDVRGLAEVNHLGPSYIDWTSTLSLPNSVRTSFLRGCGLPDNLIEYLPSFVNSAIQFFSCFISYSTVDQSFAERLHADLQANGVRCWFAQHDIRGGQKVHEQIDKAIRVYDRLLLVLSESSMSSEWVKTEIAHARQKEMREHRQVLFPLSLVKFDVIKDWVCFDADRGKDSAREIREYYIPDFTDWKDHDSYQRAFAKLLSDLRTDVCPIADKES